jgi:hypothetical protein
MALAACAERGDTPIAPTPPPPPVVSVSLVVPGDTVVPGSPLVVTVRGPQVTGQVTGTLGAVPMLFGRQTDSTMVALTPEAPAGPAVLRVSIGGGTGQATVTVRAVPTIAAPATTVTTAINQALAAVPATPPAGITAASWQAHVAELQKMSADAKGWLPTAPPAEQLASARLMEQVRVALAGMPANVEAPAMLVPAREASPLASSPVTTACVVQAGFFLTAMTAYLAAITVVVLALLAPGVNVLLALPGLLLVAQSLPQLTPAAVKVIDACGTQQVVLLATQPFVAVRSGAAAVAPWTGGAMAMNALTFERGKGLRLYPGETVKPFDASQLNAEPALANASAAVERLYAAVASMPDWARGKLALLPPRLSTMPAQAPVTRAAPVSAVRIENITGGVTLRVTPDGDALVVEASSPLSTSVPFTFDVVSTTTPTVRQTLSATLLVPVSVTVTPSTVSVPIGQSTQLTATVAGTSNSQVTYALVSGTAAVSATGLVRPQLPGIVVVRATSVADPTKSATATVTATIPFGQSYTADLGTWQWPDHVYQGCTWKYRYTNVKLRVTYSPPVRAGSLYRVEDYFTWTYEYYGGVPSSCGNSSGDRFGSAYAYDVDATGAYTTELSSGRFALNALGNLTLVGSSFLGNFIAR